MAGVYSIQLHDNVVYIAWDARPVVVAYYIY